MKKEILEQALKQTEIKICLLETKQEQLERLIHIYNGYIADYESGVMPFSSNLISNTQNELDKMQNKIRDLNKKIYKKRCLKEVLEQNLEFVKGAENAKND